MLAFAAVDRAVVVLEERAAALLGSVRQHLEWLALESVLVAVVAVLVADALAGLAGEAFGFDSDEAAVEEAVAGSGDAGSCLASTKIAPPVVAWRVELEEQGVAALQRSDRLAAGAPDVDVVGFLAPAAPAGNG